LIEIGQRWSTFATTSRTTAFAIASTAAFATTTRSITSAGPHRLSGSLSLLIAQLSVAIGVELLDHPSTHFPIAARTLVLLILRRRLSHEKWKCQHQRR
jgi:hypothetical protein